VRVIAYVRVSSEEQAESRAGLEAQRAAIQRECERRGWQIAGVIEDAGFSAKDLKRPGVRAALEELERGRADGQPWRMSLRPLLSSSAASSVSALVKRSLRRGSKGFGWVGPNRFRRGLLTASGRCAVER
jgi:Resolvase, N terminal domain